MKLLGSHASPFARKVRVFALEKGIELPVAGPAHGLPGRATVVCDHPTLRLKATLNPSRAGRRKSGC